MKAAVVSSQAAAPEYAEFADPAAADGRELVDLVAAGIHPIVRSLAAGLALRQHGRLADDPGR